MDLAGNVLNTLRMGARDSMAAQQQNNANALAPLQREAVQLGMDQTRQSMAFDAEKMAMARREVSERAAAGIRSQADAEALAATLDQGKRLLTAVAAGGPGADMAWREIAAGLGNPDLELNRDTFALAGEIAGGIEEGLLSAAGNARFGAPEPEVEPTSGMREYQFAVDQGFDGTFADWKAGGRPQTNVNVNTGNGPQPTLLGTQGLVAIPDPNSPQGYRVEPAEGSPAMEAARKAATESAGLRAKSESKDQQQRLMLGTTLSSINLNLADIEDGGLPVTGAIGDFRRTNVGRALTGSGAVDFGNRTNQVTDSAALAEIQRMRDNSPTGGAVGALTDGERVAIGNAVTALNNSTSAVEYARAAKAFRDLSLDLSYGKGNWQLAPDGQAVVVRDGAAAPSGAPPDVDPGVWEFMSEEQRALWQN